mmetsp:Transcript_5392/g.5932  ORF Transcript_5392/g.5932 Transcript_5392/m.5932 type:complete len:296 (-) Transcript_5392:66-953(-)
MENLTENQVVYTFFGYGRVTNLNARRDGFVEIDSKFGKVITKRERVRTAVTIFIKTFYDARRKFEYEFPASATILDVKERFLAQNFPDMLTSSIRLIYPMGSLRELEGDQTLEDLGIGHNAQLIMTVLQSFTWDEQLKGSSIQLLNDNYMANKNSETQYELVLATRGFASGKVYWEIKIDTYYEPEDIIIGVANDDVNLYTRPNIGKFWGYIATGAKKIAENIYEDYGETCHIGDIIGISLEYNKGNATLSFSRNGTSFGKAFTDLYGKLYPAVGLYYGEVQVTLLSKPRFSPQR